jgi:uncharacterized membrane protein
VASPAQQNQGLPIPPLRQVGMLQPFTWLKAGWRDFLANPGPSLVYGVIIFLLAVLVLGLALYTPHFIAAGISAFLFTGPLLAAGIYELSRERDEGRKPSFRMSFSVLLREAQAVGYYSLVLILMALIWERVGTVLFALFYEGAPLGIEDFLGKVFVTGEYLPVAIAWLIGEIILASIVFAICVVGLPDVVGRRIDIITAIVTSVKATRLNLPAMAVWAGIIVVLALGAIFAGLLGLIVVMPVLGHATWRAYRDIVG